MLGILFISARSPSASLQLFHHFPSLSISSLALQHPSQDIPEPHYQWGCSTRTPSQAVTAAMLKLRVLGREHVGREEGQKSKRCRNSFSSGAERIFHRPLSRRSNLSVSRHVMSDDSNFTTFCIMYLFGDDDMVAPPKVAPPPSTDCTSCLLAPFDAKQLNPEQQMVLIVLIQLN